MLLSEFTTYPVLASPRPVEVSDEELLRVGVSNPRYEIAQILREKRVAPIYFEVRQIGRHVAGQIAELAKNNTLDNHLLRKKSEGRWRNLEQTINLQATWHLKQVVVTDDEISALVTRWLVLLFGQEKALQGEVEIGGAKIVNGIITPTPGGRRVQENLTSR